MKIQIIETLTDLKLLVKSFLSKIRPIELLIRFLIFIVYIVFKGIKFKFRKNSGIKILIINHHFDQDIEFLEEASKVKNILILVLKHNLIFGVSNCYFKKEERDLISYQNISVTKRNSYRKVIKKIIKIIRFFYNFDIVITPSDSFFWIREFVLELKDKNIPTIVVDKEGTISPYFFEKHPKEIREKFPFISDFLFVWSKRQKEFWLKAGVDENKIFIIGQPRSDFFFRSYKWLSRNELKLPLNKKIILFYVYDRDAYVPLELFEKGLTWEEMISDTLKVFEDLTINRKDVFIVIKTHPQQRDFKFILYRLPKNRNNIKLYTGSYLSNHLLVNADIVVGFQTTALIEAMFLDIPIIYTFWDKNIEKFKEYLIPFHNSEAVDVVTSVMDFKNKLENYIVNGYKISQIVKNRRKEFINEYFYNSDGNVSIRILDCIENLLKKNENC